MDMPHLFPRLVLAEQYFNRLIDRPDRALSLFGPRQIGKTTFITGDLAALATAHGVVAVYVDLMAAEHPLEAINGAFGDALYARKTRPLRETVKGLRLLGSGVELDAAPAPPTSADPGQQLQHLAADLLRQRGVKRVLLMLDEVQEVARLASGAQTMKAVRALSNAHKSAGRLLLLMTGSSQSGLASLFASHGKPSFGLAERLDFPVLGRDYVRHVVARANVGRSRGHKLDFETFYDAFSRMGNRPADLEAFVGHVVTYNLADVASAVDGFLASRYPPDDLAARFKAMTALQQLLLHEIAAGATEMTSQRMQGVVEAGLGTRISTSGIRKALISLPSDVLDNPARGVYLIVDPLLEQWLRARPAARPRAA